MARTKARAKQHPVDQPGETAEPAHAPPPDEADETRHGTGLFLSRFVYTTCYTVSYGLVFPAALLARSVPRDNAAVRGLIDGAEAARQKVAQFQIAPPPARTDEAEPLPSPA